MAKHGICLNGMLFPAIADPEWIPQIPDYPVSPGDLYVVTYPKSGTTWVQQIMALIQTGGGQKNKHIFDSIRFLECAGKEACYVSHINIRKSLLKW